MLSGTWQAQGQTWRQRLAFINLFAYVSAATQESYFKDFFPRLREIFSILLSVLLDHSLPRK